MKHHFLRQQNLIHEAYHWCTQKKTSLYQIKWNDSREQIMLGWGHTNYDFNN